MVEIHDSLPIQTDGLRWTKDGYLVGTAKIARAGNVQMYRGHEIGLVSDELFGVYRDPSMVFAEDALRSLAHRPVTREHPPGGVNADSWRDLAVGSVGGTIMRDGEYVTAPMVIYDATAAKEVMEGARGLSAGYTCDIEQHDGVAPDGTPYQFRQTGELRFNHVAYLPDSQPRAGTTRIGDSKGRKPVSKEAKMADFRTIVLGKRAVKVADEDVANVEAFKEEVEEQVEAIEEKVDEKDEEIARLKAEIERLQAELDAAKEDVPTEEELEAKIEELVEEKLDTVEKAESIDSSIDLRGLSPKAIRRKVVEAKIGDSVKGKSQDYIDARFDGLAERSKGNGTRRLANSLADHRPAAQVGTKQAYEDALARAKPQNKRYQRA